jgi:hypothetical protein
LSEARKRAGSNDLLQGKIEMFKEGLKEGRLGSLGDLFEEERSRFLLQPFEQFLDRGATKET